MTIGRNRRRRVERARPQGVGPEALAELKGGLDLGDLGDAESRNLQKITDVGPLQSLQPPTVGKERSRERKGRLTRHTLLEGATAGAKENRPKLGIRQPFRTFRDEALPFRDGVFDTVVSGLVFCSVPDPRRGLAEVRRVLRPAGALRMLEHVRSTRRWKARAQDALQPVWTRLTGGCHPNRDTERTVEAAGFRIDPDGRRAKGDMRRFAARPPA